MSRPILFPSSGALPQETTLEREIKSYSLPYGAVGFASHLIAFYIIVVLSKSRSPLTWRKSTGKVFGQIISAISITGSLSAGLMAISRCDSLDSFQAVGLMEIAFSVTLGCFSYHAASWIGRSAKTDEEATIHGKRSIDEEEQQLVESVDTQSRERLYWNENLQKQEKITSSQNLGRGNGNLAVDILESAMAEKRDTTEEGTGPKCNPQELDVVDRCLFHDLMLHTDGSTLSRHAGDNE